ncbi:MAG: HU family DNA-binding protein [Bacteroidales bacterium]
MNIQYKVAELGQPGVKGGGEKKYYAVIKHNSTCAWKDLIAKMCENSSLNHLTCKHVMAAFFYTMEELLQNGHRVNLKDFGNFSLSLESEGKDNPKDVGLNSIKKVHVNFRASVEMKKELMKALQDGKKCKA